MKATSLSVNLKLGCNARCPFCISRTTVKPSELVDAGRGFKAALTRALGFAAFHRVDTVLITGTGEPLLDVGTVCTVAQAADDHGLPIVEVQTNGSFLLQFDGRVGAVPLDAIRDAGVNTVAISVAAMDPVESAAIMGLPDDYNYLGVARAVVRAGLLCRVCLNLTRDFDLTELKPYVDRLVRKGVHQLTLRQLGVPEVCRDDAAARRVVEWVEENKLEDELEVALEGRVISEGTFLRPLPHGEAVYDYRGLSVSVSTCMTELDSDKFLGPTHPMQQKVRSLILQPDGHVYHSWNRRGSVLL